MRKLLAFLFPVWLLLYSVYSFSQTDPNLVLSSSPVYLTFQQHMWQLGFHNRLWSTIIFVTLVVLLFISYEAIITLLKRSVLLKKQVIILFVASLITLLPSYPALSHDIFNYLFNAKMVVAYQANPHVQVALDFPSDPWLAFMHNVHTPAPYGYGWTAFSIIPYIVGNGYLQGEILIFRLAMIGSLLLCLWLVSKVETVPLDRLALLAFNPLILIEIVSTVHNDFVMMAAALAGGLLIRKGYRQKQWFFVGLGVLCFAFSVSIKFASIALLGAVVAAYLIKKLTLPQWSVLSLWSPLLTTQSQRFLPWYLSWSLVFLPLIKSQRWMKVMLATSFAGLLSYGFILYQGEYSPSLLLWRSGLLFGLPIVVLLVIIHNKNTK